MKPKKIFSIPLNPNLSEDAFYKVFLPFVKKYKDWIFDIYFTARCKPFVQDAMGIPVNEDHYKNLVLNALHVKAQTGVEVSATYNNIRISPSAENLKLFQDDFAWTYEQGIRSITLPFSHWVVNVKHQYPDLYVKNTILWRVHTPQQMVNAVEFGFDHINIDRDMIRDRDALEGFKRAQTYLHNKYNKYVRIALLANETCLGTCPLLDEHSTYNTSRTDSMPSYFDNDVSFWSCKNWLGSDPAIPFKTANFTPWREDWDDLLQYVDIVKMHGREDIRRLNETLNLVKNYANGNDIIDDSFHQYIDHYKIPEKRMLGWRHKIKNCKFQCWDCNACDDIAKEKIVEQPETPRKYERPIMHLIDTPFDNGHKKVK